MVWLCWLVDDLEVSTNFLGPPHLDRGWPMWSLSSPQITGCALLGWTGQTCDKNRYKMTQFISIIMELMLHIIKLSMNLWSSPGLSGCHGATMFTIERIFLMVVPGDQCSTGREGARTETWCYNNDCSKAPRFSSIIHQGFACLLCWGWFIINMIPHLQTRDQGRPRTNISKSSIPYKCIFLHFATNYSIATRILIHSLDLKGQRCMGYGRWKLAS